MRLSTRMLNALRLQLVAKCKPTLSLSLSLYIYIYGWEAAEKALPEGGRKTGAPCGPALSGRLN